MENSPSIRVVFIIVLLIVTLNNGNSFRTPFHIALRSRQHLRPKETFEYHYSLSHNNDDNNTDSANPSTKGFPINYLGTSNDSRFSSETKYPKAKVAPTIDSDLLRFLSSQKKNPIIPPTSPKYEIESRINLNQKYTESLKPNSTTYPKYTLKNNDLESASIETFPSNEKKLVKDGDNVISSNHIGKEQHWVDQFEAEKVTKILLSYGCLREEARTAGITVQNHAYLRMRKRSVNRFLKDRDELWATYKMINATTTRTREGTKGQYGLIVTKLVSDENSIKNVTEIINGKELSSYDNVEQIISLLMESGLTATDCAAILSHTPSIALMCAKRNAIKENPNDQEKRNKSDGVTLEETLNRAFSEVLFKSLKLKKYDARKVLRTCPGLLTKRGSLGGEKMIALLSSLGASPASLARDKRTLPALLARSPSSLFRLVAFLSSDVIRMPIKNIGPLIRNSASIELLDAVCPSPKPVDESDFLNDSLGILPSMPKGILIRDQIDKSYTKMRQTAVALHEELGISNVAKMIQAYPGILLLDPTTQIYPIADFLYNELGISDVGVAQVLLSFPVLLKTDIKKMRETVEYLLELEVSQYDVGKIIRAFPVILTIDKQKQMVSVVEFLREIGVVNIGRFITRIPAILGYSVENDLKPKWGYLTQVCGLDYFEVVKFPAYFSYPLDRITTRFEYLRSKRIPLRLVNVDTVLRFGDDDFAITVAGDKDSGKSFREYMKERKSTRRTRQKKQGNDKQYKGNKGDNNTRKEKRN